MSLRPRDFGYYEEQESWLYEKGWDDWAVIPGKPQSGGGKDGLVPGTDDIDPIEKYDDWDDDTEKELFQKVYRWGENPVRTAMDKLELKDINSQESLIAVDEWLIENYGDIFDEEEEDDKREPYVPTIYEPTELEITDYTPSQVMKIQRSDINLPSAPMNTHPMKISGIKPTLNHGNLHTAKS